MNVPRKDTLDHRRAGLRLQDGGADSWGKYSWMQTNRVHLDCSLHKGTVSLEKCYFCWLQQRVTCCGWMSAAALINARLPFISLVWRRSCRTSLTAAPWTQRRSAFRRRSGLRVQKSRKSAITKLITELKISFACIFEYVIWCEWNM